MALGTLAPQLRVVEDAHETLGLTFRQIAAALRVDESTVHRWRAGDSEPRAVFIGRLEALGEFLVELRDAFPPPVARKWLEGEPEGLGGQRPIDLLLEGRIEPLTRRLLRLNTGQTL